MSAFAQLARAREQWVFVHEEFVIGRFRCPPGAPAWSTVNHVGGSWPLLVYPGVPVRITQLGREPIVADTSMAVLYPPGQEYRRGVVSERGDECIYFAVSSDLVRDAWAEHDRAVAERSEIDFGRSSVPIDPQTYLLHHLLLRYVTAPSPDPLATAEALYDLVSRTAAGAATGKLVDRDRGSCSRERTRSAHRDVIEAVRELIGRRLTERLLLADVAAAVNLSPFHLARLFRDHTGTTIHEYRTRQRLIAAVGRLDDPGQDLSDLAVDLGFSHHSHFTNSFRRLFGLPPATLRTAVAKPSTILQALRPRGL